MRSNSGKGKSNNNLLDPTMKEHEEQQRNEGAKGPAQAHRGDLEPAHSDDAGRPQQPAAGPIERH